MRLLASGLAVTATLAASLAVPGCGGNTAIPPSPSALGETLSVKLTTAHFQILADRTEWSVLQHVANTLESVYPRITSDFETPAVPRTDVRVWATQAGYVAEQVERRGWANEASRGWCLDAQTISIRADTGSAAAVAECAVHELAHIVSLSLNPAWAAGVPMWLRETVALYEAGQFRSPASFAYMRAGDYPTIAGFGNDIARIVDVGFVLGEYIVGTWGTHGFVVLIRASGDIPAALGVSTQEFESGWYAFLHEKYGLPSR